MPENYGKRRRERTLRDFETVIERQIREAEERGEFENLPGAGKPIPGLDRPHDELWWVRQMLEREDIAFLPGHLQLRRDAEKAIERALAAPTEAAARRIITELNGKIADHNRTATSGPGSDLAAIDVDEVLRRRGSARS
jgi:hypothetical protein